jgi:thioredoxin-related protein
VRVRYIIIFLLCGLFLALPVKGAYAINWKSDFDAAMAEAKSSGKPLMVDFYTEWCTWCKKLEADTYTDNDVAELSNQFVCAKIDADKNRALVVKYMVRGYPTILFLNPDGQTSKIVSGYLPPQQFAGAMKFALARAGKPVEPTRIITRIVEPIFKLSGVILGPHISKAIINGVSVVEGDVIQGAKVIQITGEKVILMTQGRKVSLDVDKK